MCIWKVTLSDGRKEPYYFARESHSRKCASIWIQISAVQFLALFELSFRLRWHSDFHLVAAIIMSRFKKNQSTILAWFRAGLEDMMWQMQHRLGISSVTAPGIVTSIGGGKFGPSTTLSWIFPVDFLCCIHLSAIQRAFDLNHMLRSSVTYPLAALDASIVNRSALLIFISVASCYNHLPPFVPPSPSACRVKWSEETSSPSLQSAILFLASKLEFGFVWCWSPNLIFCHLLLSVSFVTALSDSRDPFASAPSSSSPYSQLNLKSKWLKVDDCDRWTSFNLAYSRTVLKSGTPSRYKLQMCCQGLWDQTYIPMDKY